MEEKAYPYTSGKTGKSPYFRFCHYKASKATKVTIYDFTKYDS